MQVLTFNRARAVLGLALLGLLASAALVSAASQFFQGFESNTYDWEDVTRVPSGSNGIVSSAGAFHAEAEEGAYTQWGGYENDFPANGYTTSVDVYLDVDGGYANDTRFDWTSAINTPAGNHRRDFVFNAGFYSDSDSTGSGPRFVVSAGNNAGRSNSFPKNPGRDPFTITSSGWYTFEHRFYDNGAGVLAVDLTIRDSSGVALHTWTLSDASDVIGVTVGGHRYGWFATNELPFLAIDNSRLFTAVGPPETKDDCKKDGWKQYNTPREFKNQGDCIQYLNTGK